MFIKNVHKECLYIIKNVYKECSHKHFNYCTQYSFYKEYSPKEEECFRFPEEPEEYDSEKDEFRIITHENSALRKIMRSK